MNYTRKVKDDVIIFRLFKDEKKRFIEFAKKSKSSSLTVWILEILKKESNYHE